MYLSKVLPVSLPCQFLEKTQLLYNTKAKEVGVYVVESCGFDSIPSDMGVTYTRDKFAGKGSMLTAVKPSSWL